MSRIKLTAALFFLSVFLISGFRSHAQKDDYYDKGFIHNDDLIYKENIHAVLLYRVGNELSPPAFILHSDEKLLFSFDDFEQVVKKYYFTVIHCDAYWNTSMIQQMEYISGFNYEEINDYRYSYNTTRKYINYRGYFPTEYIQVTKSGNYIIKVYENDDSDENVIFTRRFMVVDPLVEVQGTVNKTTNLDVRYSGQEVEFRILSNQITIREPHNELHVVVRQNSRWDNAVLNQQPGKIIGNTYEYTLNENLTFIAGNEFRYFDMKTLRYNTDRMNSLVYLEDGYHVYLFPDENMKYKDYRSEEDINGRCLIAANQTRDPYTEGDYAWVHFFLPYEAPEARGTFYVLGGLCDWQFKAENRMDYDYENHAYSAKIYLKQGYYNYAYAFLPNGAMAGDVSLTEGSHWETENEYQILVYWRRPGDFYDQLVAIHFLSSVD